MDNLASIVLAAGKGTRMKSTLPKVLHKVGGKYLVSHVLDTVAPISEQTIIVVGSGAQQVQEELGNKFTYCLQEQQLGTGHALQMAVPFLDKNIKTLLVLCGDAPLITEETINNMAEMFMDTESSCLLLSTIQEQPLGYGRIVRNTADQVIKIVEQKDATPEEQLIKEINAGAYFFNYQDILDIIFNIKPNNSQGEYYLTDIIEELCKQNKKVTAYVTPDSQEIIGINDRMQLAVAESILRQRKNKNLMTCGVTIIDPTTTYIDTDVIIGNDTVIEPQCYLRGRTLIGNNCHIKMGCDINNSFIGNNSVVDKAVLNEAKVGNNANLGPFCYLRPHTVLGDNVKIGDFVEIKNSYIDNGSKVPHLSYIGDSQMGKKVNIGCGTITCNYDGYTKHQTIIGDNVFVGSNTNLVSPVTIEDGAFIAAGSTITKNVAKDSLAITRADEKQIKGWAEKYREKKENK